MTSRSSPAADEAPSIAARLNSLERVMGVVDNRVDDHYLRSARDVTRRITERLSLSPAHTVVALAGATGSGKSSLYNALAGLDLSEVGVRRPVTNAPHACVWGPDGAGPLLDWLSIPYDNRTTRESALDAESQAELRGLVLLDLPDHDSTQLAHRLEVDRLVELVDLLVWVLDPQKYADEAVHARYLRRLSRHAGVTVVVLNQVDLLSRAEAEACLADARRLLDADGLRGVPLLPLSALRRDGLPELKDRITTTVASRQAAVQRLAANLDDVAAELAPLAGPEVREDVDRGSAKRLYTTLAEAAGAAAVGEAVERGYKLTASRNLGWPLIHWFGHAKADPLAPLRDNAGKGPRNRARTTTRPAVLHPVQRPQVEEALRHLADDAANALPEPWPGLVHRAARSELDALPDALDRAVAAADLGLARRPAWWWGWRIVQYLLVVALFGGVAWTFGLAIAAAVGDSDSAPDVGALALPLVLLFGGLVLGPVLHLVGVVLTRRGARQARNRAEQAVLDAVTTVARERVLAPVRAELSAYALVRDALIEFGVSAPRSARERRGPADDDETATGVNQGLGPLPSAVGYPDPFQATPSTSALRPTTPGASSPETGQLMTDQPTPSHSDAVPFEAQPGHPGLGNAAPARPDFTRPDPGSADAARPDAPRPDVPRLDAGRPDSGRDNEGQQPWQSGARQQAAPLPWQSLAGSAMPPPPPAPDAVRRGAIPPAPPLGPGGRPFHGGNTPPPPMMHTAAGAQPSAGSPGAHGTPTATAAGREVPPSAPSLGARATGTSSRSASPGDPGSQAGPGSPAGPGSQAGPGSPATPTSGASTGGPQLPPRPSLARRSGAKLPPAPPPRPAVEADPEVVWARTRPSAVRPTSPAAAPGDLGAARDAGGRASAPGRNTPAQTTSAHNTSAQNPSDSSDAAAEAKPERKGLRGLFNRRKESADVVDRWWATTEDGDDDPFGRPPVSGPTDGSRPRVPGQR